MSTILLLIYIWTTHAGFAVNGGEEVIQEQRVAVRDPIPYAAITMQKAKEICTMARHEMRSYVVECRYYEILTMEATPTERAAAIIRAIGR